MKVKIQSIMQIEYWKFSEVKRTLSMKLFALTLHFGIFFYMTQLIINNKNILNAYNEAKHQLFQMVTTLVIEKLIKYTNS